jgi:hypothetical protein
MVQITLYLDMDGVLTNFEKAYRAMWHEYTYDHERFREAVLNRKIFENLEWMPNGKAFIDGICNLQAMYPNLNIEMLTSTGTQRTEPKLAAIEQKTNWLKNNDIIYKPNFVCSKPEKSEYAIEGKTILVDDSPGCIQPFIEKGGVGFLHTDSEYRTTLDKLDWYLDEAHRVII